MIKLSGSQDYYPTPESLLDKITEGITWGAINTVLEPSAGKGNIAEYVASKLEDERYMTKRESIDRIDCIEIEPELRAILTDKKFRVVHDNFLTFHTYKHYDMIIMNPPFSEGARHLLKAIEIQKTTGGAILCILNAETIRNTFTNERKALEQSLNAYGAKIEYYENAFSDAENPTDVEIAVVKVIIPEPERKTTIFESLREKDYEEYEDRRDSSELAEADYVKIFVSLYNREIEWGLRLYDEFLELKARSLNEECQINFTVKAPHIDSIEFSVNDYVREVRRKYWYKLFRHPEFIKKMTSNLEKKYLSRVEEFVNYDFSFWNIRTIQIEITKSLVQGVEDCIIELFDKLSYQHSYDEDLKHNIHYYNGWKTNSAYKINKRVILPLNVYYRYYDNSYDYSPLVHSGGTLSDIERVLNYLDNGETEEIDLNKILYEARETGQTKNIQCKYFRVTFYKKGTCHLTFTNERVLKKFNIFGSQKKGWLPKGYAKKRYFEMDSEERSVIDSFEGQESYNESVMDSQYYLFEASASLPMLGGGE